MKLRIDGQQVHFRIDKSELTRLCLGASLNQCIHFPNGRGLTVSVLTGRSTSPMQLIFDNDVMQLLVDRGSAYDLLKALPRKEGIATHQPFNSDQRMEIILDVDLRLQNYPGKDHEWA
ncbi:DUF7009 family protein [Cohaesibacter marisflavi]|uniref:DUF7009 family protein n=1 Tax=Cohaesibacter marisflavi TaxID=655353 RepID=UPI0029C84D48|nr:hypothetical protein [Cohaesibacter marisflavi]